MVGVLKEGLRRLGSGTVDIASLAAFRIGFGALMFAASLRFFLHGWIREYDLTPKHFFHYWGFGWITPWPASWMYVHYALMATFALFVAIGLFYRVSIVLFGALFVYAHFVDKTNYLNHYYLVACLALVMAFLPLDRAASVRVWRRPEEAWSRIPTWCLSLVRFQIGCVYFFGGVAKLKPDWLLHAQPLTIWLSANAEFPWIGPWFHEKAVAYAFSWAGAAFDLTIVSWLSIRKTRPLAMTAVVVFHAVTARLFQLGMFPWIMTASALIFFDPSWPRARLERCRLLAPPDRATSGPVRTTLPRWATPLVVAYVVWHVGMPLRHWLYPGNVLWTEEGFRFAWNVMLMEKNGALDVRVTDPRTGKTFVVDPADFLTRYQIKMMSTQPDMILEFAHVVADDFARRGMPGVEVHVDAEVSLNGRRPAPLVDPRVDLAKEKEGLAPKTWLLPAPAHPPEF